MNRVKILILVLAGIVLSTVFTFHTGSGGSLAASAKLKSISLSDRELTLIVGRTAVLKATVSPADTADKTVLWSSSNVKVAKVGPKGEVTGVKAGKATITAKSKDGAASTKCEVTVKPDPYASLPAKVANRIRNATVIKNPNPIVGTSYGTDFVKNTREAIKNAGGLEKLIKKGSTVLLKPNMIKGAPPEAGMITDYRVIQAIADLVKQLGAAKVIVADGSPWGRPFKEDQTCYNKLKGVELVDFNDCTADDCYRLKPEKHVGYGDIGYFIPKIYMDADTIITVAKLKTHSEAVATLSLKNIFGVPPLYVSGTGFIGKESLHSFGVHESIVNLNMVARPDFAVIDGIIGGEGDMPINGTPVNSKVMLAGSDLVALDTVALNYMGMTVDDVYHVELAAEAGLGICDLKKIKIVGPDILKKKMHFKRW